MSQELLLLYTSQANASALMLWINLTKYTRVYIIWITVIILILIDELSKIKENRLYEKYEPNN